MLDDVEKILYECFVKEPFHNFYQLKNVTPLTYKYGGTCSDKSRSFLEKLKSYGYDAHLHSSLINGLETHRVVRVDVDGRSFLADVGNGWPSIHLYPLFEEISYTAFGMQFRSELLNDRIRVYHTNTGDEHLLFEAFFKCKPEKEILQDIEHRFSRNIRYPFSGKIRFSQIVKNRFLFLKDDVLRIYGESDYQEVIGIETQKVSSILQEYFNFDLDEFETVTSIRI